jgi:hypothetical protein
MIPTTQISTSKIPITFTLDESTLPDIKGWKVGKKYTLELKVEMVGQSSESDLDQNPQKKTKEMTARFKIISAQSDTGKPPEPNDVPQVSQRLAERSKQGK